MIFSLQSMPAGKVFANLARKYLGVFTQATSVLPIERHFFILCLAGNSRKALTQKEIGEAIQADKVSVARSVDYLEQHGLVVRKTNPDDRRTWFITITPAGKKISGKVVRIFEQTEKVAFEGFSDAELKKLSGFLNRINENLSKVPGKDVSVNYSTRKK